MESSKKILLSTIFIAVLIVLASGVTFAFFNYTRTGLANNIRVGRMYFNTSQNGSINLTNVFPIKSEDLDADQNNHDSVTITIAGDTNYSEGIEYLVTFTDVNNRINNKAMPLAFSVESSGVGEASNDYYNERGDDTSVYLLDEEGRVTKDKYILVGYIAPGQTGINGSITITSYIDADRIAITDTYPQVTPNYQHNPNITNAEINDCVSYLTNLWGPESETADPQNNIWQTVQEGETYHDFCAGTGTDWGYSFDAVFAHNWFDPADVEYFVEHNIIVDTNNYTNDTSTEWINGRTVFTTEEWNSLGGNNSLSFKIKVEANEGIWVEPEPTPASCFTFSVIELSSSAYNPSRTIDDINKCVNYNNNYYGLELEGDTVDVGETYQSYCAGTGTIWGETIQEQIEENYLSQETINYYEKINIITNTYDTSILDYNASCGSDVVIPKTISINKTTEEILYNDARTTDDINACVEFFEEEYGEEIEGDTVDVGETYYDYCAGTGTNWGNTIKYDLFDNIFSDSMIDYLLSINILKVDELEYEVIEKVVEIYGQDSIHDGSAGAFMDKGLNSVIIPSSVKNIRKDAFSRNNLTHVIIPNGVETLGGFAGNKLTSIDIPNSVTSIGSYAFANNELTSVTIPENVTYIGSYAFQYNHISSIELNEGLNTIEFSAFADNELTSVEIPDSVTKIKSQSFQGNNISSLKLGSGIGEISATGTCDTDSFDWTKITYLDKNNFDADLFSSLSASSNKLQGDLVLGNTASDIGARAFQGNNLTSVYIPGNIKRIQPLAFSSNQLTSVTIANGVEKIENSAFYHNLITSINIPDSITQIDSGAFSGNQLTEVTIGSGITNMGASVFEKSNTYNLNLVSISFAKSCSVIKAMNNYPWIGSSNRAGTTIYGANNEVCDAFS